MIYIAINCSQLEQVGEEIFCLSLFLGSLAVVQDGCGQFAYRPLLPAKVGSHLGQLQQVRSHIVNKLLY